MLDIREEAHSRLHKERRNVNSSFAAFKAPRLCIRSKKSFKFICSLQVRDPYHVRKIWTTRRIQCWNGVSRTGVTFLAKTYFHVFAFTRRSRWWSGQFGIQYFHREYQNTIFHVKSTYHITSHWFWCFDLCFSFFLQDEVVNVKLPKFKLNANFEMRDTLKSLGLEDLVQKQTSDLSLMAPGDTLQLSQFRHR